MSIQALQYVACLEEVGGGDEKIECCHRALMYFLASYMDSDGRCWLGISRMEKHLNLSEGQVARVLRSLQRMGLLDYTLERNTERIVTNRYFFPGMTPPPRTQRANRDGVTAS